MTWSLGNRLTRHPSWRWLRNFSKSSTNTSQQVEVLWINVQQQQQQHDTMSPKRDIIHSCWK
eukprot:4442729-Amphidinium_carterae.1